MVPGSGSATMPLIQLRAASIWLRSLDAILIVPSSSMSTLAPVSATISRITLPPVPMTSRILSLGICIVSMRGAWALSSLRLWSSALAISPRIWARPSFAWESAVRMISSVIPATLMSICREVMPSDVPATLKSMSPRWSSSPRMSLITAKSLPSRIRPMAKRAPGELAVAGLTPRRSAEAPDFADRVGREVIVQHEALVGEALQPVDHLLGLLGAERGGDDRLRLAAGEERRAVGAREEAGADLDRANGLRVAAVDAA